MSTKWLAISFSVNRTISTTRHKLKTKQRSETHPCNTLLQTAKNRIGHHQGYALR